SDSSFIRPVFIFGSVGAGDVLRVIVSGGGDHLDSREIEVSLNTRRVVRAPSTNFTGTIPEMVRYGPGAVRVRHRLYFLVVAFAPDIFWSGCDYKGHYRQNSSVAHFMSATS